MRQQKRLLIILLLIPVFLLSGKLELRKVAPESARSSQIHPLEQHFGKVLEREKISKDQSRLSDRVLVMLVDFVEDDEAITTGNGKFVFADDTYPLSLGSPPHDQEYYWWVINSVRYYYHAASLGEFDMKYDIYPQVEYTPQDSAVVAYTLPQKMSYYNPAGADTELMISRFEEYFHDIFTTVDADSTVDFSLYGHFVVVHAGSDSQHDIKGDSPSDIPSFFITVGDGKEVIVDDGIVIDHACNVPETISQDGQYGVTNAVTAHEFGHSLGFIDLYSTMTGASQVGWYDIMDSGGMGELIVGEIDGEVVTIEGGLPTLPNAWHRILAWEDVFRAKGYLKDIGELNWENEIRISPAEKLVTAFNSGEIYFVKVPLTETEYLLIENRQVDPDGDSGLSFKGALPITPGSTDYRILLYPTYPGIDAGDDPTYEYDLFLPGWQGVGPDGNTYNYGGGLVIWHIDDKIIYEEGDWIEGEFYSNYDRNTVNALHTRRGIKILEADGFDDIGNYNDSYNMLGSAYDPFYRYYPILDRDGNFVDWDDSGQAAGYIPTNEDDFIHTIEFNGASSPQLVTNEGDPFMFGLWDISSYSVNANTERKMSFRYGSHFFDEIKVLGEYASIESISPVAENFLGFPGFAFATEDKILMQHLVGDEWGNYFEIEYDYSGDIIQPVLARDIDQDDQEEILFAIDSMLVTIDGVSFQEELFSSKITESPLYFTLDDQMHRAISFSDRLLVNRTELDVKDSRLSFDGECLIASEKGRVSYIDPETAEIIADYQIDDLSTGRVPVVFVSTEDERKVSFIVTDKREIWRITKDEAAKVFDGSYVTDAIPSQLLLTPLEEGGRVWIVFGAGEYLFAITEYGTLAEGYPIFMEGDLIQSGSWLKSMQMNDEYLIVMQKENGSQQTLNSNGDYSLGFSAVFAGNEENSRYWYDRELESLNWLGDDAKGKLLNGRRIVSSNNPLINSGYRHNDCNLYRGLMKSNSVDTDQFDAYAFPNPAHASRVVLRVFTAPDDISINLYDIAGNLILKRQKKLEDYQYQDIALPIEDLSSGIYYAQVKSGSKSLTVPIGIEK